MNRSRTPTQRFLALCDLLDTARDMAPTDAAACERRLRVKAARQQEREQWRAQYRRLFAANRAELDSIMEPNDPRRAKFESWIA
ncbi:MAG TPA: hypothetical protein VFC46_07645 [Humisphaera sp.]|nr:hypothetical protein [Humisphaera sp.]